MTRAIDGTLVNPFPIEFEPYRNLIYVPLDLETPIVDEKEFLEWFNLTYLKDGETSRNESDGVQLSSEASKSLMPSQNNKNIYPWHIVYLHRHRLKTDNYDECLSQFPAIKEYIDRLPFETNSSISILKQHPGVNVGIHTDFDLWFGIRFYLINKSNARIFFQTAKNPTEQRISTFDKNGKRIPWDQLVNDEKIYARYPYPTCSFHLTSTHAAHGVEAVPENDDCSRITFFFTGRLNIVKYKELLDRSLAKYGDYAIWR